MVVTRREKWKGKYRIVVRDRGRIVSHERWGGERTVASAERQVRRTGTLKTDVKRFPIYKGKKVSYNVVEDFSARPKIKEGRLNQEVIRFNIGGKVIATRGMGFRDKGDSMYAFSKRTLENNAFARLSEAYGGEYDADEGRRIFAELSKKNRIVVSKGIVRYSKV